MSTLAVLLIIGAAVVGPIEGKPGQPTCVASYGCEFGETLPELCARAMKEIGAHKVEYLGSLTRDTKPEQTIWVVDGNAGPADGVAHSAYQGVRAICIPVPEGYKR